MLNVLTAAKVPSAHAPFLSSGPAGICNYSLGHIACVQNVINQFTKLAHGKRVSFLGNVTVGRDISLAALRRQYNGVRHSSPTAD